MIKVRILEIEAELEEVVRLLDSLGLSTPPASPPLPMSPAAESAPSAFAQEETPAQLGHGEEEDCVHHWKIGRPSDGVAHGVCQNCGAEKDFEHDHDAADGAPAGAAELVTVFNRQSKRQVLHAAVCGHARRALESRPVALDQVNFLLSDTTVQKHSCVFKRAKTASP